MHAMKRIEAALEKFMFHSRWLLAPFYLGLVVSISLLLVKFSQELFHILLHFLDSTENEVVLAILALVDLSLVANLLIIIIFAGYENFVSKIDTGGNEDRPEWMGKVTYSGLKIKLIASIVAISAIELLKSFVNVTAHDNRELAWKVGIHAILLASGVLFALMDRIAEGTVHIKESRK